MILIQEAFICSYIDSLHICEYKFSGRVQPVLPQMTMSAFHLRPPGRQADTRSISFSGNSSRSFFFPAFYLSHSTTRFSSLVAHILSQKKVWLCFHGSSLNALGTKNKQNKSPYKKPEGELASTHGLSSNSWNLNFRASPFLQRLSNPMAQMIPLSIPC